MIGDRTVPVRCGSNDPHYKKYIYTIRALASARGSVVTKKKEKKNTITRGPEGPESGRNMRVRGPEGPEDELR